MAFHELLSSLMEIYTNAFCGILFAWYASALVKKRFAGASALIAAGYAAGRWLLTELIPSQDPGSSAVLVRTLLLLVLSVVLCLSCLCFRPRLIFYICLSWQAVFVLAFFISYTVVLAAAPIYDAMAEAFVSARTDPDRYISDVLVVAHLFNLLMSVVLTALCIVAVRRIVHGFPRIRRDLSGPPFRLMVLPAVIGLLLWILLAPLVIIVSDGTPQLLYDLYPPLTAIIPAAALVAGFGIVQAVYTCRDMMELEEERSGRVVAEAQLQSLKELMQDAQEQNAHVSRMRHDLTNTLTVIQALAEDIPEGEALHAYLTDLYGEMEKMERPYRTGDPVADMLLAAKSRELQKAAPETQLDAQGLILQKCPGISSYDLGIILGNALDNAIRAVSEQEEGPRLIRLRTFYHENLLGLVVANTLKGSVQAAPDGLPESTKQGSDHGLGLYNIRAIAAKYDGTMDWETQNGLFTLSVMLAPKAPEKKTPAAGS